MFTSAEANELRAYYTRYPFDDESNHWLPHGFLMAKLSNMLSNGEPKTATEFMPFATIAEKEPEPEVPHEPRPYSKKQLKRIQKYKGW
jgi:hypothetical protein